MTTVNNVVLILGLATGILGKIIDDKVDMFHEDHGSRSLEMAKVAFVTIFVCCVTIAKNPYVTASCLVVGTAGAFIVPDEYFHDPFWTSTTIFTGFLAILMYALYHRHQDTSDMLRLLLVISLPVALCFAPDIIASISTQISPNMGTAVHSSIYRTCHGMFSDAVGLDSNDWTSTRGYFGRMSFLDRLFRDKLF
jgi:hypothetical protein